MKKTIKILILVTFFYSCSCIFLAATVEKAAKKALKNGYSFGASTENEIKLAKIVCDAFP